MALDRAAVGDDSATGRLKHAHYDTYALSLLVDAIGQDLISASEGGVRSGACAHALVAVKMITNASPTRQFHMGCP